MSGRGVGFRQRLAVINDHDHANCRNLTELPRREHRDANASVAGGTDRDRRIAVDGYAVVDVIRIVEQPERAFSPAFDLAIDLEPARRCDGLPRYSAFGKKLARTR